MQTFALPLGYGAMPACRAPGVPCLRFFHPAALWGWKDSAPPGFPPQLHNEVNPQNGAVDETRTRDLNLGKVALYQLSYYRVKLRLAAGWCGRRDLNSYDRSHQILSLARLPFRHVRKSLCPGTARAQQRFQAQMIL